MDFLKRYKLGTRIMIGIVTAIVGVGLILIPLFIFQFNRVLDQEEIERSEAKHNTLLASLHARAQAAADMANLLAQTDEVTAAMARNDREFLRQMFLTTFENLKREQGWTKLQFHGPDNITIFRGHKPNKYSDDLTTIRPDVARVNQEKHPYMGLARGVSGLGIRGVVPASHQGRHVGAVEFGRDFDENFVTDFKTTHQADVIFHLKGKDGFQLYARTTDSHLETAELEAALAGTSLIKRTTVEGEPKLIHAGLITDSLNQPVGVIELVMDNQSNISALRSVWLAVALAVFLATLLTGIMIFYLRRTISLPLINISNGLNDGASQVSASADQVAGSGQELADGAAEQAASLEETSSSLDEISSMTRQNADNAGMADTLMRETGSIVQKAADAMSELTTSMEQINSASTETQKIVKTIDEIAFQTNLLALNAAVEAARAGEAGAGFAVVADEVRNLAMRAAEAAKDTAALIDETVSRVGQGSSLVEQTNSTFSEVTSSTKKAAGLVGEIAAASGEQAQGIGQLNQAMSEMDTVVQRTAANSEESAAAAEELSAMSSQMMDYVGELLALVEGSSAAQATMSSQPHSRQLKRPAGAARHRQTPPSTRPPKKKTPALSAPPAQTAAKPHAKKKAEAAKAIPFEDDDFEDF